MKLKDLFMKNSNSIIEYSSSKTDLLEGINFVGMQQKIYEFVLKKMKELNPTMHISYASELAKTTDSFFTKAFDKCIDSFNTSIDISEIEDELKITIEAVSNEIVDFFDDQMNHPSGYSARKLIGLTKNDLKHDEIDLLIKKIYPGLDKELDNRN